MGAEEREKVTEIRCLNRGEWSWADWTEGSKVERCVLLKTKPYAKACCTQKGPFIAFDSTAN